MNGKSPILNQINLVAKDFEATMDFYRRLGLDVSETSGPGESIRHARVVFPDGFRLELDNQTLARIYNAAWQEPGVSSRVVIGFSLPSAEAVDERYDELLAAGYSGRQPPYDAFWGARYAILSDPNGLDIGLMGPHEEIRRSWPPTESPPL